MLTYDLDKRGEKSLYEYLYECIKTDIRKGKIAKGARLPSKRNLAGNLGISVITVENAYAQLILEGYLFSEERKGYYVSKEKHEREERKIRKPFVSRYPDKEYFADLQANKMPRANFPYSVWAGFMREVLTARDDRLLKTVPFNGIESLRVAIAGYLYENRGMTVSPDCIVVGAGTEYLYGKIRAMLGQEYIYGVEDPGYSLIDKVLEGLGVKWEHVSIDGLGADIKKMEEKGIGVMHISPSNQFPTGRRMPAQRRRELLEWADKKDGRYIVEDDFDCEFRTGGKPLPTLFSMDEREKVIYMNTFSKSLTPSIRISYMVLPKHLMEKYKSLLGFYACTVSGFEQLTMEKFLSSGGFERHLTRMRKYYNEIRNYFISEITKSALGKRVKVYETEAGTQFLLSVSTEMTDQELADKLREEDVNAAFLTQHCAGEQCMVPHVMVVNYSSIQKEQIPDIIRRMEKIICKK